MKDVSNEPLLVRFARSYGWRAYAIPVLLVITVWVVVDVARGGMAEDSPPAATSPSSAVQVETTAAQPVDSGRGPGPDPATYESHISREVGELPPGGPYTEQGTGRYHLAGKAGPKIGVGATQTFTYTVEVEEGIAASEYGGDDAFAALVDATLNDPRGWTHDEQFAFQHVDGTQPVTPDLRIQLSSIATTHAACGHDIAMETSCFTAVGNRVIINEARWVRGAITFAGDLGSYRRYLINHEVGHGIGYANHVPCGGEGALAPVMMQQTLSLSNSVLHSIDPNEVYDDDDRQCRYNPWPFPNP
ncbi:DUF3152 domain-containing protein [Corynebacterium choanae]|uniref:DUF3152 domain-containing protein n=1 Tax=Corynebacterium choanae TaxID=1862358 RepID=A0A3G6J4R0_9CORY|nr:DUF3152 domain-containing protein [Corynebacterium choanae]AZA12936.1 hypothetical protein CCHOA_02595 [Corynebacterium choanae]